MQSAPRIPSAAVTLAVSLGSNTKYVDLMNEVRSVNFKDLEITFQMRFALQARSYRGIGIVLHIPGKERGARDEALFSKLKDLSQGKEEIFVVHPVKTTENMLSELVNSITAAEMIRAVAASGVYKESDESAGVIRWLAMRRIWFQEGNIGQEGDCGVILNPSIRSVGSSISVGIHSTGMLETIASLR